MRFKVEKRKVERGGVLVEEEILEIYEESTENLIACLYPERDGRSIKILSKYATGEVEIDRKRWPQHAADGRRITALTVRIAGEEAPADPPTSTLEQLPLEIERLKKWLEAIAQTGHYGEVHMASVCPACKAQEALDGKAAP